MTFIDTPVTPSPLCGISYSFICIIPQTVLALEGFLLAL